MRIGGFLLLWLTLVGLSAAQDSAQSTPAQDTNFSVGPQYLMTSGSPLFARPLAPPTLSFDQPPPQSETSYSSDVVHEASDTVIETPPALQSQADLFPTFYGVPSVPVAVVRYGESSAEVVPPTNLPASIANTGVAGITDAQSLRQQGYGFTLAQAADYWKSHRTAAPRVYTNEDIERLRGGI
jgi:hypothetical protein